MRRIATLVAGIALIVPSAALAQGSSTCQAYNPALCSVGAGTTPSSTTGSPTTSPTTADTTASSGTLPFTGLDVVLLAAGGGTLVGAGLFVRQMSRRLN